MEKDTAAIVSHKCDRITAATLLIGVNIQGGGGEGWGCEVATTLLCIVVAEGGGGVVGEITITRQVLEDV